MSDGEEHSLNSISIRTGIRSVASVSARIRDLRKLQFGGFTVDKRKNEALGDFRYRLLV